MLTGEENHYGHNRLHCRVCGKGINCASPAPGRPDTGPPQDGAFSICLYCGEVSVYERGPFGVLMREPSMDELAEFNRDHSDVAALRAQYIAQREDPT